MLKADRRQTFNPDSSKFEMNVHSKKKRLRFLFNLSNGKVEIPNIEQKKLNDRELLPSISNSGTRLNGNFTKSITHNVHFSFANITPWKIHRGCLLG